MGKRPRGMIEWRPQRRTEALLEHVQTALDQYANHLPLTLRQILYHIIAVFGYGKKIYGPLSDALNRARRSGRIPWSAIRDDGVIRIKPPAWESADEFVEVVRNTAANAMMVRQAGQRCRIVVSCESRGMTPVLVPVAHEFGVEVISKGGYDSSTIREEVAREWAGLHIHLLRVSDCDGHGKKIETALWEDLAAFSGVYGYSIDIVRVALTPEQAQALNLPSKVDGKGDEEWQAEALPPDVLAALLRQAIVERLDMAVYERVLAEEERMRAEIMRTLFP
jgi:hypothetical protein